MMDDVQRSLAPAFEAQQEALLRATTPAFEAQQEALQRTLASGMGAQLDAMQRQAEAYRETVIEPLRRAAEAFQDAWQKAIPPNLRDLDEDALWDALQVSAASGPCVIWAPRTQIVEEIIKAESFSDRGVILIAHREEVLSDALSVLGASTIEVVEEQGNARHLAGAAIAAARGGHDEAAQALIAAALGCVLHRVLRYEQLGRAYREMSQRNIEDAYLDVMRLVAIQAATGQALVHTSKHEEGFNRHGTLHGYRAFYGEAEMLAGLLLLVAWIRELSWWAEHDPSVLIEQVD